MLQTTEQREVITGGFTEVRKFTIQNSVKMFRITVSGLYADKVKAVLREYLANAYDAQLQAGNPEKPFDLHLPTQWEPWFSVRDYGCSMDHEGVMNNFASIGWSSKDGSSKEVSKDLASRQVGKFGLGCKVGFAYSDTFAVIAIRNGEKRTYNAYIDEDGAPLIAHAFTEATDEPNGIEITVPVNVADIDNFKRAATDVLRGFDVQPKLTGAKVVTGTDEVVLSGTGWKLFATKSSFSAAFKAQARQGTVIYPIDEAAIPGLTHFQRLILQEQILINFEVGEIDITPSRESLSYDPQTIENIKKRISTIEAEMRSSIDAKIADQPNVWTARIALSKLEGTLSVRYNLRDSLLKNVKYRGQILESRTTINHNGVTYFYATPGSGNLLKRSSLKQQVAVLQRLCVQVKDDTVVIISADDRPQKKPVTRIQNFLRARQIVAGGSVPGLLYLTVPSYRSKAYVQLVRDLGGMPFIRLEQLPEPPKQVRAPSGPRQKNPQFEARVVMSGGKPSASHYTVDTAGAGYYIQVEEREYRDHVGNVLSERKLSNMIDLLMDFGTLPKGTQVFVIPSVKKKVIKKAKGWINVVDLAFEVANQPVSTATTELSTYVSNLKSSNAYHICQKLFSYGYSYPAPHVIGRLREAALQNIDTASIYKETAYCNLRNFFDLPPVVSTNYPDLAEEFFQAYPLLKHLDRYSYYGDDYAKSVKDYISLLDQRN